MTALRPLGKLTFAITPAPSSDVGQPGELAWLPLKQLYIDPAYQRAILDSGKANIRRMVEGFSWLLFATIVVARRGKNSFAIVDGQHRATAALIHGGIDKVPCLILKGGQAAEARAFSAINGNVTRIHSLQSFRASVAAGDTAAKQLVELCAKANVTIAAYPKQELDPGETMALGYIRRVQRQYGDKILIAALTALRTMDKFVGLPADAIQGAAAALHAKQEWANNAEKVGAKIAESGRIARMISRAQERKLTRGGAVWMNFQAVFTEAVAATERSTTAPLSRLMAGR